MHLKTYKKKMSPNRVLQSNVCLSGANNNCDVKYLKLHYLIIIRTWFTCIFVTTAMCTFAISWLEGSNVSRSARISGNRPWMPQMSNQEVSLVMRVVYKPETKQQSTKWKSADSDCEILSTWFPNHATWFPNMKTWLLTMWNCVQKQKSFPPLCL